MNRADETITQQAAQWLIASDGDDMDWDGFTRWLEVDPRHREAYDEMALAVAVFDVHRAAGQDVSFAANDDEAPGKGAFGWKRWGGMAIAASLVAALFLPQFMAGGPDHYVSKADGRTIALDDGSRIYLAPHSSIEVAADQARVALNGAAYFNIVHNPSRALVVSVDGIEVTDIGTLFDIQGAGGQVRVAVAEGKVRVSSQALDKPIDLAAGRSLTFDPGRGTALVRDMRAEDAGGWRSGQLSYEAAPLTLVAADLDRYAGIHVSVDPQLRDRRFSGTLIVGNGEKAVRDLARLVGVELTGSAGAYRLVDKSR